MKVNKIKSRWLLAAWLLPVAWLVGCSTDNGAAPADEAGARPIVFSVSTDAQEVSATRGVPLDELDGEFGLFCATYTGSWGEGQKLNYMYNEMVIGSGSTWTTSEGYFVPSSSTNLKFFAYYPYYEDVTSTEATAASPITQMSDNVYPYAKPSFTYTMPQNAVDQLDLMYAISDEVHADAQGKLATVHLNFHHLLTAITIAAKCNEGGTIKRVTLKNLYPTGEFEFAEGGVLRAEKTGARSVYADLDLKLTPAYKRADDGLSFMLIRQPVNGDGDPDLSNGAVMEVLYEAVGGKQFTFTKSLADMATSLTQSKHTLLQLSVDSMKKITVKATITDWEHGANFDGAVSDQPVLELEPLVSDWEATDDNDNSTTTNITTGPNPTVTGYTAPQTSDPTPEP